MPPVCAICLNHVTGKEYHQSCVEALFGTSTLPHLNVERAKLYTFAAQMAGKMSISGVQEKVSLRLSSDKKKLQVAPRGGQYILKPDSARFPSIPQNEHVTMLMAKLVDIDIPPLGLISLTDGSLAYIIKRFDRLDHRAKLRVEDFCQLSEKPLKDKYQGSAELCVRILKQYASEPLIEVRKLFKLLLFSWWVANGDLHLKNFSLLTTLEQIHRLSPAYDLVSTQLVLPEDRLALPVGGKDKNLTRRSWLDFAAYCEIPERAAKRLISEQIDALDLAVDVVTRSFLPDDMKDQYHRILRQNTATLSV